MSYDPKWIRDDAVVKRDGTNDLTGDWDIGDQRKIVLEELQIRDASGLTISDTTANILVSVDNQTGLFSLRQGSGINEFSTDTTLAGNSDNAVPTEKAVKTYVDTSISGLTTNHNDLIGLQGGDSTAEEYYHLSEDVYNNFRGITSFVHNQSEDSTSWVVVHNLGYRYVNVQVVDSNNLAIIPDEIEFQSTSQLTITFLQEETGYAAVSSGGGEAGAGIRAGRVNLLTDDATADVVFDLPHENTTYSVSVSISNNVDTDVSEYLYTIFDKTVNGFSVKFSGPIENDNYYLEWITGIGGADEDRVWVSVTDDYDAKVGNKLMVFTDSAAITVTLPASPVFGDQIDIVDGDINFATNNCTIGRNGNNIDGNAGDYVLDADKADIRLVYANSSTGWRVING